MKPSTLQELLHHVTLSDPRTTWTLKPDRFFYDWELACRVEFGSDYGLASTALESLTEDELAHHVAALRWSLAQALHAYGSQLEAMADPGWDPPSSLTHYTGLPTPKLRPAYVVDPGVILS